MTREEIARYIDHTNLNPKASSLDIEHLCKEALQYGFAAVCVNPCRVRQAAELLEGRGVNVASVIGFPFGASRIGTSSSPQIVSSCNLANH